MGRGGNEGGDGGDNDGENEGKNGENGKNEAENGENDGASVPYPARFSPVRADTIEIPDWDIDPAPPPADWAMVGPRPAHIPWNL